MCRNVVVALVILLSSTSAFAQVKIDGPKEAFVGSRIKAKLTLDVTDPIIKCLPENADWYAVQDLAGNRFIDFVPTKASIPDGTDSQVYTFVVAGTKDAKTFLETYTVSVKHDPDCSPGPKPPSITDTQLYKDVLAAYKVNPNASALTLLRQNFIAFTNEVKADQYSSASVAGQSLASKFHNKDLQSCRDVISTYLGQNAGNTWNKPKLVTALDTINKVLAAIPE